MKKIMEMNDRWDNTPLHIACAKVSGRLQESIFVINIARHSIFTQNLSIHIIFQICIARKRQMCGCITLQCTCSHCSSPGTSRGGGGPHVRWSSDWQQGQDYWQSRPLVVELGVCLYRSRCDAVSNSVIGQYYRPTAFMIFFTERGRTNTSSSCKF